MNNDIKEKRETINHHMILNAFNLNNLGLFRGKMGIILYFFIFSKYTHNETYENFAFELLSDLVNKINTQTPLFSDDGLCSIGWGIEYLVQNNYINGDTNEILSEFDHFIMQIDTTRIVDDNEDTNMLGLINYIVTRLTSIARNDVTPFDPKYLKNIYDTIISMHQLATNKFHPIFKDFVEYFQQPFTRRINFNISLIKNSLEIANINENNIKTYPLGLINGLSGACLKSIYTYE